MIRSLMTLTVLTMSLTAFANSPATPGEHAATEHAATTTTTSTATGATTTLSYKEAKATCMKEKPELKGKDLRTCVTQKQIAAKGGTPAAATK